MQDPLKVLRQTSAFRGAILTFGMRGADRLLGVASTLILARLLVPEDFGLVAMASVVAGLMSVLLDLGVGAALIQNQRADSEDFHTAWSLRLGQAMLAAVLLAVFAPLVADYYSDARVAPILRIVAITVFIGGLENIGTVSFQRNMEFGRDIQFIFLKRLLGVAFTITAALALRTYWALVLGGLVSTIAGVALSYWLSDFRPRLSISRLSRIWAYSRWHLLAGVGSYLNGAIGRLVIGRHANAEILGAYSVGEEIASMPTTDMLAPLGRIIFPAFAAARHDSNELLRLAILAQSVYSLIVIPASVGVLLVAEEAVPLLLGDHWRMAIPFVQIIAIAGIPNALGQAQGYLLVALGEIRTVCVYQWSKVAVLLAFVAALLPTLDALGVAIARVLTAFVALIAVHYLVRRVLPAFRHQGFIRQVWRPLLSSAVMVAAILLIPGSLGPQSAFVRLVTEIALGAVTYSACVLLLWRAAGSPPGAETYILEKMRARSGSGTDLPRD